MDYDEWLIAVDQCLKSQGKGFTVSQIDPKFLIQAFGAGTSPVIFARSADATMLLTTATYLPRTRPRFNWDVPHPSTRIVRVVHLALTILGWFFWGFAGLALLSFALLLIGVTLTAITSTYSQEATGAGVLLSFFVGPFAIVYSITFFFFGCISHWLAQLLVIDFHRSIPKP